MKKIIEALEEFAPLSEEIQQAIASIIIIKELPKGHLLLKEGETCRHLGFIAKGIIRAYYYQDGKDITTWFCMEDEPCVSLSSFISQRPSHEYIELLEDSTLFLVHYDALQDLYKRFPQLNLIGRLVTEKYFLDLANRTLSLQHSSSKDRYLRLLNNRPEIIQRAPLTHIASYLGMTKENLSRIRRQ